MGKRKNTVVFTGLAWGSMIMSLGFIIVGLWHAPWVLVEKGYYAAAFLWSVSSAFTLAKVVRDNEDDKEAGIGYPSYTKNDDAKGKE